MNAVTKINSGIARLTLPYKDIFTTVYTVQTSCGVLLFDTASSSEDVDQCILPFLSELGIAADQLKYIFISHNHKDHAGGLARLAECFPAACIVSRSPDLHSRFGNRPFLCPNDNDPLLDVLRVITIPGHTMDCAAILDTRTNILISGDCLQLYGIFGSSDWASNITLPAPHLQAVEKVRAMHPDCILAAHDYHPMGYRYCGQAEVERALDACVEPLRIIRDLIVTYPEADDQQIRALYNASGDRPTVRVSVVCALRAMLDSGQAPDF